MSDGFDVAEAVGGGIVDRQRAWAFVRDFASAWGAPLSDADATPAAELARAEAALGLRFPAALREAHALFGARLDLVSNLDPLLTPDEVFVHDGLGGVLVYRSENQGCAFWGVRLEDLHLDDPPVFVEARHGWVRFMDRLSVAIVELVLSEALIGDGRLCDASELSADLVGVAGERFRRVALPDYPMWTGAEDYPVRWFSAPGKLLRQDGLGVGCVLHVRGRTRGDLEAICQTIPGQWRWGVG
ncbi:hypothetical protein [Stackebrandtia nassauensis]|uniref:Knr4/Smi1-like domain-containing protein n=1 Tax=Stackebrandtia nassauensis (strain DSM 44728 / CIP 108903 / NRRL B-16338 / NBRC 102104 / LLR-40K-21) TaxID=446470 RepID=D3Q0Q1_STANL|nr:hypothetical protein [Stackebrandtia nassauensis]ADD41787.1 hypothetical protein Snas_2093 [Stackebrandtia nassauensis DSM 44728]